MNQALNSLKRFQEINKSLSEPISSDCTVEILEINKYMLSRRNLHFYLESFLKISDDAFNFIHRHHSIKFTRKQTFLIRIK